MSDDLRVDCDRVRAWLDDDSDLRIPETGWGVDLYSSLRALLAATPAPEVADDEREALADWLGALPESRNVFDYTDEAVTAISIGVEHLADLLITEGWTRRAPVAEARPDGDALAAVRALVEDLVRMNAETAISLDTWPAARRLVQIVRGATPESGERRV